MFRALEIENSIHNYLPYQGHRKAFLHFMHRNGVATPALYIAIFGPWKAVTVILSVTLTLTVTLTLMPTTNLTLILNPNPKTNPKPNLQNTMKRTFKNVKIIVECATYAVQPKHATAKPLMQSIAPGANFRSFNLHRKGINAKKLTLTLTLLAGKGGVREFITSATLAFPSTSCLVDDVSRHLWA